MGSLYAVIRKTIKKAYALLAHSSPEVDFRCKCLLSAERESMTQRPLLLALRILLLNVLCRLRLHYAGRAVGRSYLSPFLVRPPVYDLAAQMLECPRLLTDLAGSAFLLLKSREDFYAALESELGPPGFARLRRRLDDPTMPLADIYRRIGEKLHADISCEAELRLAGQLLVPNRYALRLLDIARYNHVEVIAAVPTSYPRPFVEGLLRKYSVQVDNLVLTCEEQRPLAAAARPLITENTAVFSADFRFVRQAGKLHGHTPRPLYYHDPRKLLRYIRKPRLAPGFADVFYGLCGLQLFGGEVKPGAAYELAWLCVAPAVAAGIRELPEGAPPEMARAVADFRWAADAYVAEHDPSFAVNREDAAKLYAFARRRIERMVRG